MVHAVAVLRLDEVVHMVDMGICTVSKPEFTLYIKLRRCPLQSVCVTIECHSDNIFNI